MTFSFFNKPSINKPSVYTVFPCPVVEVIKPIPVYLRDELAFAEAPDKNDSTCVFAQKLKKRKRRAFEKVKQEKNVEIGRSYEACVEADVNEAIDLCRRVQRKLEINDKLETFEACNNLLCLSK